ncbi:hypothetical protein ACMA1D_31000 [Streptomyces sp. 796.1]|uniref:hypothetical protein n=1 Tax=Streptomyces sp. 796.1 TaxID=3163029 RepID=UPI0039C9047E
MEDRRDGETAAETVERAVEDAERDVTDENPDERDSEAGDTLTPSPHAQRQAADPGGTGAGDTDGAE